MISKTMAAVLLTFALGAPLAAHNGPAGDSAGDSLLVTVEIPARTAAPTPPPTAAPTATPSPTASASPAPTSTASPAPADPGSDAANPRPGALPATGGEIAVGAAVLALLALVAGLAIRARRRRRV